MHTVIDHWNNRYRLREPGLRGRLDDLARGAVCDAMDVALQQAFGDGPTVYLVRRVDCRWVANPAAVDNDYDALAKVWGRKLADAVVRTIRDDPGNGNVVCYTDTAAHLSAFIEEVLAGREGAEWMFAAFAKYRSATPRATLRALLAAHVSAFGAVVARLHTDGGLLRLLRVLDPETVRSLWMRSIAGNSDASPEADRPLFAAAVNVWERLGGNSIDRRRAEALFVEYVSQLPHAANWRDTRSLAKATLTAFRFLQSRLDGALKFDRVQEATSGLDWMDREWLNFQLPQSEAVDLNESDRPLFAAALAILRKLGAMAIGNSRAKELFVEFSRLAPEPVDWRDRQSLANRVLAGVRYLRRRLEFGATFTSEGIDAATADLDWLDQQWLRSQLRRLPTATAQPKRRVRPQRSATPKQQEVLSALQKAIALRRADLDNSDLNSTSNCVLLFAAVAARRSSWVDDAAVKQLIALVIRCAAAIRSAPHAGVILEALHRGDWDSALERETGVVREAVRDLTALGRAAVACVTALHPESVVETQVQDQRIGTKTAQGKTPQATDTDAAGVFLLWRAINDMRIFAIVSGSKFPTDDATALPRFLTAFAARCAGLPLHHGFDPGLAIFSGEDPIIIRQWLEQPIIDDPRGAMEFQQQLANAAAAHRLIDVDRPLQTATASCGGVPLMVGGDEQESAWPFVVPCAADHADVVSRWREMWNAEQAECDPSNRLIAMLEFLENGCAGSPWFDATVVAAVSVVVRAWAQWVSGMANASIPYLLAQFIRRAGRIHREGEEWIVTMEPRPLDVVLQTSGYLEPIDLSVTPNMPVQRIRFRLV